MHLVTQYFLKENCVIRGQNSSLFLLKYRNFIAIGDEIWRILSNLRVFYSRENISPVAFDADSTIGSLGISYKF